MISKWIKYKTDLLLVYELVSKEVEVLMGELQEEHLKELLGKYKNIKEAYLGKDIECYNAKLKELEAEVFLKLGLK